MQQTQLLPTPEGLPSFDDALQTLNDLIPTLYRALEDGAYKVSAYRDVEFPNETLDAGFAASILRCHSSRTLRGVGTDFQSEEWVEDKIPFMGMSFYYKQWHIRILKGPNGELPGCGDSEKKKRFYSQRSTLYLIGTETIESKCNLIVLWNFGPSYGLEQLRLALPAVAASRSEHVSAYWNELIPYPAEMSGSTVTMPPGNEGDDGMDRIIKAKSSPKENEGQSNVR